MFYTRLFSRVENQKQIQKATNSRAVKPRGILEQRSPNERLLVALLPTLKCTSNVFFVWTSINWEMTWVEIRKAANFSSCRSLTKGEEEQNNKTMWESDLENKIPSKKLLVNPN